MDNKDNNNTFGKSSRHKNKKEHQQQQHFSETSNEELNEIMRDMAREKGALARITPKTQKIALLNMIKSESGGRKSLFCCFLEWLFRKFIVSREPYVYSHKFTQDYVEFSSMNRSTLLKYRYFLKTWKLATFKETGLFIMIIPTPYFLELLKKYIGLIREKTESRKKERGI
jgi:hypothetical protein